MKKGSNSLTTVSLQKKKKRSPKSSVSQNGKSRQLCLEKIISDIIEKLLNEKLGIILPLFRGPIGSEKVPNKQLQDTNSNDAEDMEDEFIDGPMEIDFVQSNDWPATDIVTTKCKIKRLVIPGAVVDPGANFAIMSEDIAKRLKLEIDTKEKHDLKGVATVPTESLGITRNVPVVFSPGCTIYSDFAVIKYPKPMLILPNTLLNKYNYDLLASKRQLKLECDGKEFFIPINMHKVKNKLEVNCVSIASATPDCIMQDLAKNDTLKKTLMR